MRAQQNARLIHCLRVAASVIVLAVSYSDRGFAAEGRVRVGVGAADGRGDTGTPYWHTWKVEGGDTPSRRFGGVTVTLRAAGETGGGLDTLLTKAGIDTGAAMATDGVASAGGIEMEIRELTTGPHAVVTYHNSIWDDPVSRATVSCLGTGPGTGGDAPRSLEGLEPSRKVTHNDDVASAFLKFVVVGGTPLVIRIVPGEEGERRLVLLNGFEVDGADPRRKARKPSPPTMTSTSMATPPLSNSAGRPRSGRCATMSTNQAPPPVRANVRSRVANPSKGTGLNNWWIAGNLAVGSPEVTADNWLGVHPSGGVCGLREVKPRRRGEIAADG